MRKYLALKLQVKPEDIVILCRKKPLGPEHQLEFIQKIYWKDDSKMILEYRKDAA